MAGKLGGEVKPPRYEVYVGSGDRFKFTAAHFIAFKGYRERLHGHNYTVAVRVAGNAEVGPDGYVVDFGDIKRVVIALCKELNEHFLLPANGDAVDMELVGGKEWHLVCEDGTKFVMPKNDVAVLPIAHSSAEELAAYVWTRVVDAFSMEVLQRRGVTELQVTVAEAPNQQASYTRSPSHHSPGCILPCEGRNFTASPCCSGY